MNEGHGYARSDEAQYRAHTKYVTDALAASFNDELKTLGFTKPALELRATGGQKGVLYHQVQLKYATKAQLGAKSGQ